MLNFTVKTHLSEEFPFKSQLDKVDIFLPPDFATCGGIYKKHHQEQKENSGQFGH
jgi:hypothetical protein